MNSTQLVAGPVAAAPYRGEDRRSRDVGIAEPRVLTTLVVVSLISARLLVAGLSPLPSAPASLLHLADLLAVAGALTGAVVAAVCLARWRAVGDAPALWLGLSALVYGVVRVGGVRLIGAWDDPAGLLLTDALRLASLTVTLGLLGAAIASPPVDTRLRPVRLALAAAFVVAILTGMFGSAPAVVSDRLSTLLTLPLPPTALVTALLAAVTLRRGRREGRREGRSLFTWFGLLFVAVTLTEIDAATAAPAVALGNGSLQAAGLALALHGAIQEMVRSYRDQGSRLLRTQAHALLAEERVRAEQELAQERAHEARSALAAIEGATSTLERHRDRLPDDVQRRLAAAVTGEVRRLQDLVTPAPRDVQPRSFEVLAVLAPVLAVEHVRGTRVTCQAPADLIAVGRPDATTEILQTLFDNARHHACGSAVMIRAEQTGDTMVLRFEDRGPGVAPEHREAIFERGVRAGDASSAGEGLGLYVAARLAREQGGRLWVEERPGGGASFALALPAGARPQIVDQAPHRLERV